MTAEPIYRKRAIIGVKATLISALRRASTPLTTAELAERAGTSSAKVSARLLELVDEGFAVRINSRGGRGSISRWIAAPAEETP